MRGLYEAAESRRAVFREAVQRGDDPFMQPGTIWKTRDPDSQELHLAAQFYRFLFPLVRHGVPIHFLEFPRFATDVDYLIGVLGSLCAELGATDAELRRAFASVARPDLISTFRSPGDKPSKSD